jgi:hypothetical protein
VKPSIWFALILAVTLWVWGGFGLYAQAQTSPAQCSADGPKDDNGRPHCCLDGSMPEGANQCWCDPIIVHLHTYRNPSHGYEVQVPDGIAEIGCSETGPGFAISLAHPNTGEGKGDLGWNRIWVSRPGRTNETLKGLAGQWAQSRTEDSERDHSTDLQIDPPLQTSLSSLPAIQLRATRTKLDEGKLIYEEVDAKSADNYVYSIGMITPADQYTKNQELFKAIVDGFRYVPSRQAANE